MLDKTTLEKIHKEVISAAKKKTTIPYEILARRVGRDIHPDNNPDWFHTIGKYLYEINKIEKSRNSPMLSAIVVNMNTGLPGEPGFWTCAIDLEFWDGKGRKEDFWNMEKEKVWKHWSK